MNQWTDEQRRAIDTRGTNILLSAAAGSGKTTVLVERVLSLIENDGARIDRMLIVTFSRAASADMRRKLGEQLGRRAAEGSVNCLKQQPMLERASISTLHGFCSEFLREHFESAGVDPDFRVLDEAEAKRIADEALDQAMEEAYASPDEALEALTYGRQTKGVRALTEELLRVLEDRDDPEGWVRRFSSMDSDALAALSKEVCRSLKTNVRQAMSRTKAAMAQSDCTPFYEAALRTDLENMGDLLQVEELDELLRRLNGFSQTTPKRGKPTAGDNCKSLRESAKKLLRGGLCSMSLSDAFDDLRALAPQLDALGRLALRAREIGREKRAALSALTYNDLEHFTLEALRDTGTADLLRQRYDYIFVDEYQDTSEIQEALINSIRREDDLFMVGDVKQSIYGFRNAEPRLFRNKYDAYLRHGGGELLPLTRNFRSRAGILEIVNRVFALAMHGGDSEILYDELAKLNPGNPELTGGEAELHLITRPDSDERKDAELAECERQAAFIAQRILELRAEDPSLKWRDFAVLTRARKNLLAPMAAVLTAYGIPAFANDSEAYYDTLEISLAVSLLTLIVNRRSDMELIGVLRSRLVGLTLDELAIIRAAHPAGSMADAAWSYMKSEEGDGALRARLADFYEKLDRYELLSRCLELGVLTRRVFTESGLYDLACALPGGALREANLDRLCENAANYDRDISGSLTRFLRHVQKLREKGTEEEAHVVGENDDVVRLMTAHKSKGLEFPIVFGAMLQRSFNSTGNRSPLSAHRALGFGFHYCDPVLGSKRKTMIQHAVELRRKREDHAEELRVLYVLMTRAKDRLIMVGSVAKPAEYLEKSKALREDPDSAGSALELLCCALGDGADGLCSVEEHPYAAAIEPAGAEAVEVGDVPPDEELARMILWRYPDAQAARQPLKLTVTGLLRELQAPDAVERPVRRPAFLAEKTGRMSGTEQGTAFHRVMECLDFAPLRGLDVACTESEIARQADVMREKNRITQAQRDVVDISALARFFTGEIGQRLLKAEDVRREWPFNVLMRMSEALTPEEAEGFDDGEILVQGTPDCCFVEDGAWVLLDYKTDRSTDRDALKEHYQKQLRMYALALERITGKRVKEIRLCLLRSGESLRMD